MRYLKQSTSVDVGIGPFLDESDGKTAETTLTITQPDVRLKKNNGNWAQKAAAQKAARAKLRRRLNPPTGLLHIWENDVLDPDPPSSVPHAMRANRPRR